MPKKSKPKSADKAAIYVRVSTVEQSEIEYSSLEAQEQRCKEWIDYNKKTHFETYKDTKSGKDLNRPGIELLREDAKKGKFNVVVVSALDRVSRSLKDFLNRSRCSGWMIRTGTLRRIRGMV